jgi:hypothetical protein
MLPENSADRPERRKSGSRSVDMDEWVDGWRNVGVVEYAVKLRT